MTTTIRPSVATVVSSQSSSSQPARQQYDRRPAQAIYAEIVERLTALGERVGMGEIADWLSIQLTEEATPLMAKAEASHDPADWVAAKKFLVAFETRVKGYQRASGIRKSIADFAKQSPTSACISELDSALDAIFDAIDKGGDSEGLELQLRVRLNECFKALTDRAFEQQAHRDAVQLVLDNSLKRHMSQMSEASDRLALMVVLNSGGYPINLGGDFRQQVESIVLGGSDALFVAKQLAEKYGAQARAAYAEAQEAQRKVSPVAVAIVTAQERQQNGKNKKAKKQHKAAQSATIA